MKKYLLFLIAGATILNSCGKTGGLGNISQDINSDATLDLPGVPGVDTVLSGGITAYAPTLSINTNSATTLQEYNTSSDKVTSVKMTKMNITVLEPSGKTFDFMDTIRVYISADGLDEKLMAYKNGVPTGQQTVVLDCNSDIEMKEYFLKDQMRIRFGGHFISEPDEDTKLKLDFTHKLTANILK